MMDDESGDHKSSTTDHDNDQSVMVQSLSETGVPETDHGLPTRKAKRKKKTYDTITDKDLLPSSARKTKHGGYAHTNISKSRISQANAGNTPWNKGKNRSSSDRAKIAAGVRARNRAVLLEKLKRLGMSEDEWLAKKREIKYLRERLRRAKLKKKEHDESEAEMKLHAIETERKLKAAIQATTLKMEGAEPESENTTKEEDPSPKVVEQVFYKEVEWTPFSFGKNDNNKDYDQACPSGGPGGLVCCSHCAEEYTWYLSRTVKDMEMHRTSRVGKEVQELLKFLKQGRETLENAYNVAKKKIPPLPPKPPAAVQTTTPRPASSSTSRRNNASVPMEPTQWNMTSTIDIAQSTNTSVMQV